MTAFARANRHLFLAALAAAIVVLCAGTAQARHELAAQRAALPQQLWAFGLDQSTLGLMSNRAAVRARNARGNALLVDIRGLSTQQQQRLNRLQAHFDFRMVVLPTASRSVGEADAACAATKGSDPNGLCTALAASVGAARTLAASTHFDLVVVVLKRLPSSATLRELGQGHTRVIALVEIGHRASLKRRAWRHVIKQAAKESSLDLGVKPVARHRHRALVRYISLLRGMGLATSNGPTGLTIVRSSASSLKVRWKAVKHARRYGVYRNGRRFISVRRPLATIAKLRCGTSYVISVDAADRAGNRSQKRAISGQTGPCGGGGGGGGGPTVPPLPPASRFVSSNGSDSSSCAKSAPCRSFNRAYHLAKPGDVVEVAGGSYPQQNISRDSSKTSSKDVVFRPAAGAVVTIGCDTAPTDGGASVPGASCIDVDASHITFDGRGNRGFRTKSYSAGGFSYQGRIDTERGTTDIIFRNMNIGAVALGSSNTLVSHNDIGPSVDPYNNRQADGSGDVWADNLIHDFYDQERRPLRVRNLGRGHQRHLRVQRVPHVHDLLDLREAGREHQRQDRPQRLLEPGQRHEQPGREGRPGLRR